MYKVLMGKAIRRNLDYHNVTFYREIELPFPPFIGLEIESDNFRSGCVKRVIWQPDYSRFCTWEKLDKKYYKMLKALEEKYITQEEFDKHPGLEFFIEEAISEGWIRSDGKADPKGW